MEQQNISNINQINENKENKEESSIEDESLEFFKNVKRENKDETLLNKKHKNSFNDIQESKQNEKENNFNLENNNNSELLEEKTNVIKKKSKKKHKSNSNSKIVKKRAICQFYVNGACKKGENCPFSHNAEQIHKKELCKFYLSGKCTKGENCLYSHDLAEVPCKFYHGIGFCENLQNCPFSHQRLDELGINEFIKSNEDFLKDTKNKYGRTNLDEFFDIYIKEKEGNVEDEYIMLPDCIKNEDDKNNNRNKEQIPLGIVVLSNNNKVINEIKNFNRGFQNMSNNNQNNFNNKAIILNQMNNQNFAYQNLLNNNHINNNYQIDKNRIMDKNIVKSKENPKKIVNINYANKNSEKKFIQENDNIHQNKNNTNDKDIKKKEMPEINPFMNPLLISNNIINNIF